MKYLEYLRYRQPIPDSSLNHPTEPHRPISSRSPIPSCPGQAGRPYRRKRYAKTHKGVAHTLLPTYLVADLPILNLGRLRSVDITGLETAYSPLLFNERLLLLLWSVVVVRTNFRLLSLLFGCVSSTVVPAGAFDINMCYYCWT